MTRLLGLLQSNSNLSTGITLELSQLIVYTIKRSCMVTPALFEVFQERDGYVTLTNTLLQLSKFGNKEERVLYLYIHLILTFFS